MDLGCHVGIKKSMKIITHLGSRKSLKFVRRLHWSTIFEVPGLQKIIENPSNKYDDVEQHIEEPQNL